MAWIDAAGALRLPALHLQNVLLQGVSLRTAINVIHRLTFGPLTP
ncbi:hypothetical protein ACOZ0N_001182 [Cronobacter muytjensii]